RPGEIAGTPPPQSQAVISAQHSFSHQALDQRKEQGGASPFHNQTASHGNWSARQGSETTLSDRQDPRLRQEIAKSSPDLPGRSEVPPPTTSPHQLTSPGSHHSAFEAPHHSSGSA